MILIYLGENDIHKNANIHEDDVIYENSMKKLSTSAKLVDVLKPPYFRKCFKTF